MKDKPQSLVESVREQAERILDPFEASPNVEKFARDVLELLRRDEAWMEATSARLARLKAR